MNVPRLLDHKAHIILSAFLATFISFALLLGTNNSAKAFIDDGSIDPYFESSSLVDGPIYSLLNQPDGKVLVGGFFSNYLGESHNMLVRLNADGTIDNSFDIGLGFQCTEDINKTKLSISKITPQGIIVLNCGVFTMALQNDGKIIVAGYFDYVNGVQNSHVNITRLNTNGSVDATFNPGGLGIGVIEEGNLEQNGAVFDIAIQNDGKILVGGSGSIRYYNGVPTDDGLIRLNSNGSIDNTFNAAGTDTWINGVGEAGFWGDVYTLSLLSNGQILVGGNFESYLDGSTSLERTNVNNLARINSDGTIDETFQTIGDETEYEYDVDDLGPDGIVYDIVVLNDGKLLVGGEFDVYSQQAKFNFVRLSANGVLDPTFNDSTFTCPTVNPPYPFCGVNHIEVLSSGKILIGGRFIAYEGNPAMHFARLNSDGTFDNTFSGDAGSDSEYDQVIIFKVQSDGRVIIGGSFQVYNEESVDNIVRIGVEEIVTTPTATPTNAVTATPTSTPKPTSKYTKPTNPGTTLTPTPTEGPVALVLTSTIPTPIVTKKFITDVTYTPTSTPIDTQVVSQQMDLSLIICLCLILLLIFLLILFLLDRKKKKEEEEKKKQNFTKVSNK